MYMTGLPLWDKVCMNLIQKHVVLPKKFGHITPLPAHNGHLSTTAAIFCLQDGRCREV